jgi:hypothetical protein
MFRSVLNMIDSNKLYNGLSQKTFALFVSLLAPTLLRICNRSFRHIPTEHAPTRSEQSEKLAQRGKRLWQHFDEQTEVTPNRQLRRGIELQVLMPPLVIGWAKAAFSLATTVSRDGARESRL